MPSVNSPKRSFLPMVFLCLAFHRGPVLFASYSAVLWVFKTLTSLSSPLSSHCELARCSLTLFSFPLLTTLLHLYHLFYFSPFLFGLMRSLLAHFLPFLRLLLYGGNILFKSNMESNPTRNLKINSTNIFLRLQ